MMNHPKELVDFWSDMEAWNKSQDPSDWPVSRETSEMFSSHLVQLQEVAEGGNDWAKYAIASIYLLELIYPDDKTREQRFEKDRATMTQLLGQCADNGMTMAFDNLVTSGTGKIGDTARAAADAHEATTKPEWDDVSNMPQYTPAWMESARKLWIEQREEQA